MKPSDRLCALYYLLKHEDYICLSINQKIEDKASYFNGLFPLSYNQR